MAKHGVKIKNPNRFGRMSIDEINRVKARLVDVRNPLKGFWTIWRNKMDTFTAQYSGFAPFTSCFFLLAETPEELGDVIRDYHDNPASERLRELRETIEDNINSCSELIKMHKSRRLVRDWDAINSLTEQLNFFQSIADRWQKQED